jgi:hypothetical protein
MSPPITEQLQLLAQRLDAEAHDALRQCVRSDAGTDEWRTHRDRAECLQNQRSAVLITLAAMDGRGAPQSPTA